MHIMEDNNILRIVEENSQALNGIVDVTVNPDDSCIIFCRGKIRKIVITTLAYIVIAISLLLIVSCINDDWQLVPVWPVVILLCIYIVRIETRVFTVDLKERSVSIGGRWQRRCTYDWSSYRGYVIVRSVKDFPEDFYIIFQDGSKERKFKLANLTLFLRRYNPTYYDALLDVWKSIEDEMKL